MSSRVGRGFRADVDIVACFWWGGFFSAFFASICFSSNAHGLLHVRSPLASFTSLLLMRPFFASKAKKPLHAGVRTGRDYLINLSVCVPVCDIEFVVFTDRESCARPISTNPVSMEAGEYGLSRGAWCFARHLEVVTVAGLMWVSW